MFLYVNMLTSTIMNKRCTCHASFGFEFNTLLSPFLFCVCKFTSFLSTSLRLFICVFFSYLFSFFFVHKIMFLLFTSLCLSFSILMCLFFLFLNSPFFSFLFANLHLSPLCPYVCCLSSLHVYFFHLYILPISFVFANWFLYMSIFFIFTSSLFLLSKLVLLLSVSLHLSSIILVGARDFRPPWFMF